VLGLPDGITACLFDLDGVLTTTAKIHAAAWKEMFDEVLAIHDGEPGVDARPFDEASDYLTYVDGKPRYDGTRDFLASRGIHLPDGTPDDPPTAETIRNLGDRKNDSFQRILVTDGAEPFPGSVKYLEAVKAAGLKTACVSSSANAGAILDSADLAKYIDLRIDGATAEAEGIKGKPAPDMFLVAAERLGATIETAAVYEDAISGVKAGASGGFTVVIGVNRGEQPDALRAAGATIVVDDLAELLESSASAA
jgi:beta-phosphoglucomutase family hydrolase